MSTSRQRKTVLVLPDDAVLSVLSESDKTLTHIAVNDRTVAAYRVLPQTRQLVLSSIGTPYEATAAHVPAFNIIELSPHRENSSAAEALSIPDVWAVLNVLHTLYHTQETIPVLLSSAFANSQEITDYLLHSALARRSHARPDAPELYLLRATFWQGAGTAGWHTRGWLRPLHFQGPDVRGDGAAFPYVQSFTRTAQVIASHPLRPPKPRPGECVYKKYFPAVGQSLELTYVDLEDDGGGGNGGREGFVGRHLAAFHKWQNDPRVNKGWNEAGSVEKHREYLKSVMQDPGMLPLMMSWDGELMGYTEVYWAKENHVSQFVPDGVRDYDRGHHVLVGEDKFRGTARSKSWFRGTLHYMFLADPRTERILGEPRADNPAILKVCLDNGMHLQTMMDLPHKRCVMSWCPRERWFKYDLLSDERERASQFSHFGKL